MLEVSRLDNCTREKERTPTGAEGCLGRPTRLYKRRENHFWDRCHAPSDGTESVAYGDGWAIEISEVAPAFGREGGSLQVLVRNNQGINMSIQNMDEVGMLR